MRSVGLRLTALLMLSLPAATASAALLRLDYSGPSADPDVTWTGPGPLPTSFDLSFTVDTLTFDPSSYWEFPPAEFSSYRFYSVDVVAVSFIANGSELWNDPSGLTLEFGCDNQSLDPEYGAGFCYLWSDGPPVNSVYVEYDTLIPPASEMGDDPLAAILLAQAPIPSQQIVPSGEWGYLRGFGLVSVTEVPVPTAVWLFGSAVGVMGAIRRKVTETRDV